ncbi:MAG: 3-deoxy-7-phosphoheptulonate synthase [Verrucomicrobia bacterium]|nr:3-deoxy-7-phosphoheptulonate synthase [Verrucomicrobiota bacterium]
MELIAPQDLIANMPLSKKGAETIATSRKTLMRIFDRQDPRLLIIVGPCSIHNVDEALVFARQLKELAKEVEESCFIVMRAYVEKPRTRKGWLGLVHDPHLNGSHDILSGLTMTRSFLVELAEMGMPAGTEFLTPHLAPYIEDLISWGCIGARTSSSQIHRQLASLMKMPIGFKNSVDGNVDVAINAIHAARHPHHFMHINDHGKLHLVRSGGNPYTHVVLRGSSTASNYDEASVQKTLCKLREQELPPRVLIDCSHGNAQGQYFLQKKAFQSVLEQIQRGNHQVLGMMLESNLHAGAQLIYNPLDGLQPGVSVTDPCIDYSTAAELISSVSMVISSVQS